MNVNEIKKKYALELLNVAIEYDNLSLYLKNIAGYDLNVHDVDGTKVYPTYMIMESIYEKYSLNPELRLDSKFYNVMLEMFSTSKNGIVLMNLLSLLEYHLEAQKNNVAPFELDSIKLLNALSKNIKDNFDLFRQPYEPLNLRNGFMQVFEQYDFDLDKKYGSKFL